MVFARIIKEATNSWRSRLQGETADIDDMARLQALFSGEDYAGVERLARAITGRNAANADAWKALGVSLLRQGRVAEALMPMQSAAELLPNDAQARVNLGTVLHQLGRIQEAETHLRQAAEIN